MNWPAACKSIEELNAEGRVVDAKRPTAKAVSPAKPKRRQPAKMRAGWSITLRVPVRVVAEMNQRCHWSKRYSRFQTQEAETRVAWLKSPLRYCGKPWGMGWPLLVTFRHLGPKVDDDNLRGAFKAVRDAVASLLGVDDADHRVLWHYEQRLETKRGEMGIEIDVAG